MGILAVIEMSSILMGVLLGLIVGSVVAYVILKVITNARDKSLQEDLQIRVETANNCQRGPFGRDQRDDEQAGGVCR
ncbi:MAG: hypothetical protein ACYSOJ_01700 [Planctomycetota bacterium]|jgi:mannitol-specific phosphotransferase system IIBC component